MYSSRSCCFRWYVLHWAISIPCKIIPVISLMKKKFSFFWTSRDFLRIVTAWWIQKCCVQLKLHLRVKAKFAPMGALLVQKRQSLITKFITKHQFAAISHYASKIRSYYEYYFTERMKKIWIYLKRW